MTRRRIAAFAGLAVTGALALYGPALAQTVGVKGLFAARGTAQPFHIHDHASHFKLKADRPMDVAIVGAQLSAGGETGWHTHPADSIVSVAPDAPGDLLMDTTRRGRCVTRTFHRGEAFVHPAGPHNFRNSSTAAPLNFGVAYFVPVGAVLLTPATAPSACR
jgi:hypothetical protein